jgi:phage-related protein
MPPQMTGDLCNALAPGAMALLKNSPKIINAALNLTRQGIRTIIGIHTDVAKGALNIAAMPFKMTFSAAKDVTKWTGGAVTDVTKWTGGAVSGVYSGAKTVVKDVVKTAGKILPWNW